MARELGVDGEGFCRLLSGQEWPCEPLRTQIGEPLGFYPVFRLDMAVTIVGVAPWTSMEPSCVLDAVAVIPDARLSEARAYQELIMLGIVEERAVPPAGVLMTADGQSVPSDVERLEGGIFLRFRTLPEIDAAVAFHRAYCFPSLCLARMLVRACRAIPMFRKSPNC